MEKHTEVFDLAHSIHELKHYLPAQAALKDFVHHNTLHAFQAEPFHDAAWMASQQFGYTTYLAIDEFRAHFASGRIREEVLNRVIADELAKAPTSYTAAEYKNRLLHTNYEAPIQGRLAQIRKYWKEAYFLNMDKAVQPTLFRVLAAFLDQGIATRAYPFTSLPFLDSLRALDNNGFTSLFRSQRVKRLLQEGKSSIQDLLDMLIGDPAYYTQYLFDQQFSHPGWSGFVAAVERQPSTLLSQRAISLEDLIHFELLLEIDALDHKFGTDWQPLAQQCEIAIKPLFDPVERTELAKVLAMWQTAYEWSYYDEVLSEIQLADGQRVAGTPSFQGLFCIDDREYSFRRHLESLDTHCETFGTPGHFGLAFYFQPEAGHFHTKACPAPVEPAHLIKEVGRKSKRGKDIHFSKRSHHLLWGWMISNTLGFWAAIRLFFNIFRPRLSPAMAYSFQHMDGEAQLEIESEGLVEDGLQRGFTHEEMAKRVGTVLRSIGLVKDFAPLVYVVGHGASSINNPYYAGYDCGACSGRPGAVNARVFAHMANDPVVRNLLQTQGICIPDATVFVGTMHDTTRDEIAYYLEQPLPADLAVQHAANHKKFQEALVLNAQERSLRFDTIDSSANLSTIHQQVKNRSVTLFEPRPEWNHTDNALCIVGRRGLYQSLNLDKRPFINSYDCSIDPAGEYLKLILQAAVPVCGGINLEYYFSRVDQQHLGAGTKLPHNVVGLFALNTGIEGDLRPGLPSQMIEIHEPVRILFIIEHDPERVLEVIQSDAALYEWIKNGWVLLTVKHPTLPLLYRFEEGEMRPYAPLPKSKAVQHHPILSPSRHTALA